MKGVNAFLGWILTLAVLAVPSFLFYNWWAKNKTQSAGEAVVETSGKDIFSPAGPGAGAGTGQRIPSAMAAPVSSISTIPARGAIARPLIAPAQTETALTAAGPGLKPPVLTPGQQPSAARPAAVSTQTARVSTYSPKTDRNPMLSTEDYRRMKEDEQMRLEAEQAARSSRPKIYKDPGIESRIKLQGIVGNAAIINGEMYTAGQSVFGGKLIKVGADYVIGEYKGKRFKKMLK